jgi:hypothetical protein
MVVFYTARVQPLRLLTALPAAQADLAKQALSDCNRYCKVDSGRLKSSSLTASDLARGRLRWKSEYARSAYYTEGANRDKNPLASKMWAHKAGLLNRKRWRDFAAAAISGYVFSGNLRRKSVTKTSGEETELQRGRV